MGRLSQLCHLERPCHNSPEMPPTVFISLFQHLEPFLLAHSLGMLVFKPAVNVANQRDVPGFQLGNLLDGADDITVPGLPFDLSF